MLFIFSPSSHFPFAIKQIVLHINPILLHKSNKIHSKVKLIMFNFQQSLCGGGKRSFFSYLQSSYSLRILASKFNSCYYYFFLMKDDFQLVRDCISGHIYDSSPADFTSDVGTRFLLHPTILKMSHPPRIASWIVHSIASSLDALFLSRLESQRAEYWQTLYSSVVSIYEDLVPFKVFTSFSSAFIQLCFLQNMRAPYLILCSENDDLANYETICNFAQRLQDLGGDIKLVKWNDSPHVGLLLNLLTMLISTMENVKTTTN